ncbi:MAG: hypothetical protein A2901_04680 [Elusimicrobia bacterium RIFCSPLOWO2_01_FULL_54_10]|nr:MAG: hypothetical protein A2901_04680 [Elusimicrobia bacterium RIFCSPLOWO2_01_FULL_54_10]
MNLRPLFILASIALFTASLPASVSGAAFETVGVGARPLALGNSYASIAGTYEAVYWNPAGIATLGQPTLHSEYRNLYGLGILRYMSSGYVHPGVGRGALGMSWLRLDTTGDASYLDYAENTLIVSYGLKVWDTLRAGINGKYYRVNSTVGAGGMGLDLGVVYSRWGVTGGLVVSDVNRTQISWDTGAKDRIPRRVRLGFSGNPVENTLVTSQISWEDQQERAHHAGIEQTLFSKIFSLRLGFSEQNKEFRFSWGLGFKFKIFNLDYAWERQRLLGDTQVFSATMRFK